MILKGGTRYYDTPVGVLCLDSLFPKPRGHLRNPLTFGFPVVTRVITGVDVPRLLFNPTPDLLEPFVQAARELEADGVRAVTGSCGFMARFQGQIARELKVPVLLSSLVQLPLLRLLHGENAVIGVLTASAAALTPELFAACASSRDAVRIQGMDEQPEFRETILTWTAWNRKSSARQKPSRGRGLWTPCCWNARISRLLPNLFRRRRASRSTTSAGWWNTRPVRCAAENGINGRQRQKNRGGKAVENLSAPRGIHASETVATNAYFLFKPNRSTTASAPRRANSATSRPWRALSGKSSSGRFARLLSGVTPYSGGKASLKYMS